ncbi:MAG: TetR/AcrR family transcriptional regulator [Ornithinimicrobium sp.]
MTGQPAKREAVLREARRLFYRRGIRAVGVDTVAATSGVSKMTLYSYFGSKDRLIVACLESVDERYRLWLQKRVTAGGLTPQEQILGIFDALEEWFAKPTFRGCIFVNAAVELADPDHPASGPILNHKQHMRQWITGLAAEAELRDPAAVGSQVLMVMEGAVITALIDQDPAAAARGKELARYVITAHAPAGVVTTT